MTGTRCISIPTYRPQALPRPLRPGAGVRLTPLLAFHDLDRQLEIDQPRLQKGKRQHVLCVDIIRVVAGMAPHVELKERSVR